MVTFIAAIRFRLIQRWKLHKVLVKVTEAIDKGKPYVDIKRSDAIEYNIDFLLHNRGFSVGESLSRDLLRIRW